MPDLNQLVLSSLILCPLVGAVILAFLPSGAARKGAAFFALLNFVFSLHLLQHWDFAAAGYQYEFNRPWLPEFGLNYHVGVDGLSVLLVLLSTLLTPLVIFASFGNVEKHEKPFYISLLVLEAALCGVFSSLDAILFYMFYEAVLVPIYFLISIWGGSRRGYAAIKYFLVNFLGSILMWVAMFYIYFHPAGNNPRTFDLGGFTSAAQALDGSPVATWLFAGFAIAFAIKLGLFPVHTLAPDAYAEAPTAGSVMLSAVLAKIGTYGLVRFCLTMFPETSALAAPTMITLGLIAVIYGAAVAAMQTDFKRTIAYSSISHVGLIVAGIFAATLAPTHGAVALSGATLQMINHGISIAALFLLLGFLQERRGGTRLISQFGGLAAPMPRFAVLFWIALFASIGLPGLNGFVGEFLLLQGIMDAKFAYAALGATGVILGAIYMLRLCRSLLFGEITREENRNLPDVTGRELAIVGVLLALSLWIGVAPQGFLRIINPATQQTLQAQKIEPNAPQLAQRAAE